MLVQRGGESQVRSAERLWLVVEDAKPVALVATTPLSLLTGRHYICLQMLRRPSLAVLRWMQRHFPEGEFLAVCLPGTAQRFAEFLGFRQVAAGVMQR